MVMNTFTIIICEKSGQGTHHVQAYDSEDAYHAELDALNQVSEDWGMTPADLHILAILIGDVAVQHYDDSIFQ